MNTTTPIDGSGKGYIRLYRQLLDHPLRLSRKVRQPVKTLLTV